MADDNERDTWHERIGLEIHPRVFPISAVLVVSFVVLTLLNIETANALFEQVRAGIARWFGWLLVLLVQGFLLLCVGIALSRFGHIRLGGADARPQYRFVSWFAMLFSAGMGIGLVFWSVAEPVFHLIEPPVGEAGTVAAAKSAMTYTFLHWGLHAWGVYAIVGLGLAYFAYNRGAPLTLRSAFRPLLGDRVDGWIGDVVDIMSVLATLFGVATSLGFGVSQVNAGLNELFGTPDTIGMKLGLVLAITLIATASVVSGLDRGIQWLSNLNLWLALALMLFVLFAGPTLFLLSGFVQNTGEYLQQLLSLGSWTETYRRDSDWQASWTIFYWAWWIAWSPFVGLFIARISRGRAIREFLLGVLLVPSVLTFLWISVFGGAALYDELYGAAALGDAVRSNVATALYALLGEFPWATLTSGAAVILVVVFFVTSSDSGSLVIDIISSGGNLDPPVAQRVFWALSEGVVAAVLLMGGGLQALQTASIATGLPFAIVITLMCYGLIRSLQRDLPAPVPVLARRIKRSGDPPEKK